MSGLGSLDRGGLAVALPAERPLGLSGDGVVDFFGTLVGRVGESGLACKGFFHAHNLFNYLLTLRG